MTLQKNHLIFISRFFLLFLFFSQGVSILKLHAQAPEIEWQRSIGGSSFEELRSIVQNADGTYLLAGYSNSGISGDKSEPNQGNPTSADYWIIKLSDSGDILWQNTIGGSKMDNLHCVRPSSNGGYILGGWSISNLSGDKSEPSNGGNDIWIVKISSVGDIEWQKSIGGNIEDKLRVMDTTANGGYILGGYSQSGISGNKTEPCFGELDYWVIKLNRDGAIEWENTIGGDEEDVFRAVHQTSDGGYICGGYSRSGLSGDKTQPSQGDYDYWVLKLNSTGVIEWQTTIGGNSDDKLRTLQQTSDGGYICGGSSASDLSGDKTEPLLGQHDCWVIKLNASGGIEWQNAVGGTKDEVIYDMYQSTDGGYIFAGYSNSEISGDKTESCRGAYDYWVVKLDPSGEIEWQKTIGGNDDDQLFSIQPTLDGGFIFGGASISGISGDKTVASNGDYDYWIVKLGCSAPASWFADMDNDGYGDADNSIYNCSNLAGYVNNNLDCDDDNESLNPGIIESENGIDDNCNGIIDEGFCIIPTALSTSNVTSTTAQVKWSSNGEADKFTIRYSYPSSITFNVTVHDSSATQYTLTGLLPSTEYTWRIKSICDGVHTDYSKKIKFTTLALRSPSAPSAMKLEAYPNPFSDYTTITFSLESSSFVQINLVDVYGRMLKTVGAGNYDAGNNTITLDAGDLGAGIFFLQMIQGAGKNLNLKIIRQ